MSAKKSRKGRKIGRNVAKCAAYRSLRSLPNKLLKLKKHLGNHVNDGCAIRAYMRLRGAVRQAA